MHRVYPKFFFFALSCETRKFQRTTVRPILPRFSPRSIIDRMAQRGNEHPDLEPCIPFTTSHVDDTSAESGCGPTNVCDIVRVVG